MNHAMRSTVVVCSIAGSLAWSTATPVRASDHPTSATPPIGATIDRDAAGFRAYHPTYKRFGEYFEDRFRGYHVGEDSEVPPKFRGAGPVEVRAIAGGTVRFLGRVAGYGGVIVIAHDIGGGRINAIYGHLDLASTTLQRGNRVVQAQFIANLGADRSKDTDGERQHLHFALYRGNDLRLNGYERRAASVRRWMNPYDLFRRAGVLTDPPGVLTYRELDDPGGRRHFLLDFQMPTDWDVEYVPSLRALNLYTVTGAGTARERSQIFIRFFDADRFLTLPTVRIHRTEDLRIGEGSYVARRYDIEKKSTAPAFRDQPAWRNRRHTVTDFRAREGRTRYYVVASNPALDPAVVERMLASMQMLE